MSNPTPMASHGHKSANITFVDPPLRAIRYFQPYSDQRVSIKGTFPAMIFAWQDSDAKRPMQSEAECFKEQLHMDMARDPRILLVGWTQRLRDSVTRDPIYHHLQASSKMVIEELYTAALANAHAIDCGAGTESEAGEISVVMEPSSIKFVAAKGRIKAVHVFVQALLLLSTDRYLKMSPAAGPLTRFSPGPYLYSNGKKRDEPAPLTWRFKWRQDGDVETTNGTYPWPPPGYYTYEEALERERKSMFGEKLKQDHKETPGDVQRYGASFDMSRDGKNKVIRGHISMPNPYTKVRTHEAMPGDGFLANSLPSATPKPMAMSDHPLSLDIRRHGDKKLVYGHWDLVPRGKPPAELQVLDTSLVPGDHATPNSTRSRTPTPEPFLHNPSPPRSTEDAGSGLAILDDMVQRSRAEYDKALPGSDEGPTNRLAFQVNAQGMYLDPPGVGLPATANEEDIKRGLELMHLLELRAEWQEKLRKIDEQLEQHEKEARDRVHALMTFPSQVLGTEEEQGTKTPVAAVESSEPAPPGGPGASYPMACAKTKTLPKALDALDRAWEACHTDRFVAMGLDAHPRSLHAVVMPCLPMADESKTTPEEQQTTEDSADDSVLAERLTRETVLDRMSPDRSLDSWLSERSSTSVEEMD